MIHLCLLAAGSSRRFGSQKLLADCGGMPLWRRGYAVLREIASETGAHLHVISRHREILGEAGPAGVFCPESEQGVAYSIRAACHAAAPVAPGDKLLFLAADQPLVSAETLRRLLAVPLSTCPESALPLAACASDGTVRGNPAVFSGLLVPELLCLTGDTGGKAVLRAHPDRVVPVPCPARELADVDVPEDLFRLTF